MFGRTKRLAVDAADDASDVASDASDAAPAAAVPDGPYELAAIDLTTVDGRRQLGWIATDGERTSDWLNASERVAVRGLRPVAPDAELTDASLPGDGGDLPPVELERTDLLFAVPPPLPPNRHLRLHRRRVGVFLDLGEYRVSGQLHVRPGADASDYVLRSSRTMVPLTEVELVHSGEPQFRRLLEVLIVNARHVTSMTRGEGSRPAAPALVDRPAPVDRPTPVDRPAPAQPSPPTEADLLAVDADLGAALRVLLDAGLLSLEEFQAKRSVLLDRRQAQPAGPTAPPSPS